MFCPVCRDEFREGFTRCEDCDADLVIDLDMVPVSSIERPTASGGADAGAAAAGSSLFAPTMGGEQAAIDMKHLCGFISLEDARAMRDRLRSEGILTEILIREAPGGDPGRPIEEDFLVRVDGQRHAEAIQLLERDGE